MPRSGAGDPAGSVDRRRAPARLAPSSLVDVPHGAFSRESLRSLIEFVPRAGTDYGAHEKTLAEKIADVQRQLEGGEATIVLSFMQGG